MCASTRSRTSGLPVRSLLALIAATLPLHAEPHLRVYLSDNHAETFGWITRVTNLDARHRLVLVDAHSDASATERSEEIREQLRRVPSLTERSARIETWRASGRLQAFNWIEPLMPRPLEHVTWLAGSRITGDSLIRKTREATALLDGRLEVEPRDAGPFATRWDTVDLDRLERSKLPTEHVILAIDLDFFSGMAPGERDQTFERIWTQAMSWPHLTGVAFSVSRPWLNDAAEADALVHLACDAVLRTRGATMEMDVSIDDRPDQSLKALATGGTPPPRWDARTASTELKTLWAAMGSRLVMTDRKGMAEAFHREIRTAFSVRIPSADHGEPDSDGVWRFPLENAPVLRVDLDDECSGRVRWYRLEPAHAAVDLLPETGLGKGFAHQPAGRVLEIRKPLCMTEDGALTPERWAPKSPGRIRIAAEVETRQGWRITSPIEIRLWEGDGFHAALSECFGMPYVFGIAAVEEQDRTGVDTGWGADCSNLLIHAWRRIGEPLHWGDPGRLRQHLRTLAEDLTPTSRPQLDPEAVRRGVMVDFGSHVAAVWKDQPPLGTLDGGDLLLHHLGGFPEVVGLTEIAAGRGRFALRTPHPEKPAVVVRVAGDVVLAGSGRIAVDGFAKGAADWFFANLEGIPTTHAPQGNPRYDFRFPPDRLAWLRECGVDGVSLANNHAGDAGPDGLLDGIEALQSAGIRSTGAGRNAQEACRPILLEKHGVTLAVFGICGVEAMAAGPDTPGVACLPQHAALLERELLKAAADGATPVVLLHHGNEYTARVSDAQRDLIRWLARRGARWIFGSHPHVVQRTEHSCGAMIHHSLGNAVYPKALKGADSGVVVERRIGR